VCSAEIETHAPLLVYGPSRGLVVVEWALDELAVIYRASDFSESCVVPVLDEREKRIIVVQRSRSTP
jgi:hypothetical protein